MRICRMLIRRFIASIMLFIPLVAVASDLGAIGQTYPILETDFLDFIQTRLNTMQANGEMEKIQNKFKENVSNHADRPREVSGITKATSSKNWVIDPSIIVPYDLKDHNGRIFAKKGKSVNPLLYVTIHHPMVFINGDDEAQVKWVQQTLRDNLKKIKLVLVGGSVINLTKIFQQPVYFDQEGKLTNKFQIRHVPATVSQEGLRLKVQEVAI